MIVLVGESAPFVRKPAPPRRPSVTRAALHPSHRDELPALARRGGTIRDTFSFPRDDHRLFEELQQRCYAAGFSASKSELVSRHM